MLNKKPSQTYLLLRHMTLHGHITQLEAISLYRIFNIKGRICDLRDAGWEISTEMRSDATGKRYARYALASESDRQFLREQFATAEAA